MFTSATGSGILFVDHGLTLLRITDLLADLHVVRSRPLKQPCQEPRHRTHTECKLVQATGCINRPSDLHVVLI